jgi:4-hydroxybenzoate polyprenyltransferase
MRSLKNNYLYLLLRTARPRQWIKNTAVFAALVFSGFFFYQPPNELPYAVTVSFAFLIFCLLTSSVYIINDIIDRDADRNHPFKKKRPVASGALPVWFAFLASMAMLTTVFVASLFMPFFFRAMLASYLILQLLYVNWTKHVGILDVISIATGFLIRVYAGALVVNLHMSVWFLLTVVSASLFLAVGKRQSERTLLEGIKEMAKAGAKVGETRKTLKRYSQRLLDQYTSMFATATWLTYALFTFQNEFIRPDEKFGFLFSLLPKTLHNQKMLMVTVPFVIFGIMKYLQLIYEDNKGESPEIILLRDKTLLTTVMGFVVSVFAVIYVLT